MNPGPNAELTDLLHDSTWLRTFVRSLVPTHDVDDIVQSTWLAALQQRVVVHRPQQWLSGIAANLSRMLHRQRRRHAGSLQHVRAPDPEGPTADLVAGLELQHAVSEALLALPEPTRTILVLRYQQDLDSAEIARRIGLAETAVRQRLHRGRELVRTRLHKRFGADWRSCAAMVAFTGDGKTMAAPAAASGATMMAAAAFVLVGGVVGIGWIATRPVEIGAPPQTFPSIGVAVAAALPAPLADKDITRTLVEVPVQDPAGQVTANAIEIRGRIVAAEDQRPLAGARLEPRFRWPTSVSQSERRNPESTATAADGRFCVRCPTTAVSIMLWVHAEGRCMRWHDASPPRTVDLGDIPMTSGYSVKGRLVDEAGQPMENVSIGASIDGEFPGSGSMSGSAKTAADGSFSCRELFPAGQLEFRTGTSGVELIEANVDIVAKAEPNFVQLRGKRLPVIRGVVFGPDGAPCAGVELEAIDPASEPFFRNCGSGRSAADGSFEVFRERGEAARVRIQTPPTAAHELVGDAAAHDWGTSGLRLEARPLIPVHMRVLEAGTRVAVERFGAKTILQVGGTQYMSGSTNSFQYHEGGLDTFAGLAAGTRIVLCCADPLLPPVQLVIDESMRSRAVIDVEIARLQPFALTLVDSRDRPVATEFHVIDRCGAAAPEPWNDPRTGSSCTTSTCMRLSAATTDADGTATLMAPTDSRELVVALRRGDRDRWLPLVLPAAGKPVRLVVD